MNSLHIFCELNFRDLSKNSRHVIDPRKRRLVSTNTFYMKRMIQEIDVESKIQKIHWEKKKTWVLIHCTKKRKKGDAVNLLDVISDIVKQAIGIDDECYCSVIDQKVDPSAPYARVDIIIAQPDGLIETQQLICEFLEGRSL